MESFYSVTLCFLDSKRWNVTFLLFFTGSLLFSQEIPQNTLPLGIRDLDKIKPVRFSKLDNQKLLKEELEKRKNGSNPSFAVSRSTNLKPSSEGEWEIAADGKSEIWRLRIQSLGLS